MPKVKISHHNKRMDNYGPADFQIYHWSASLPFYVPIRGLLIHRVRTAQTYTRGDTVTHHAFQYWCGGSTVNRTCESLTDNPTDKRLLCEACELRASRRRLPSSDQLVGRHLHRGRLASEQTCCKEPVDGRDS